MIEGQQVNGKAAFALWVAAIGGAIGLVGNLAISGVESMGVSRSELRKEVKAAQEFANDNRNEITRFSERLGAMERTLGEVKQGQAKVLEEIRSLR